MEQIEQEITERYVNETVFGFTVKKEEEAGRMEMKLVNATTANKPKVLNKTR